MNTWERCKKELENMVDGKESEWSVFAYDIHRPETETYPVGGISQYKPGNQITITLQLVRNVIEGVVVSEV